MLAATMCYYSFILLLILKAKTIFWDEGIKFYKFKTFHFLKTTYSI